MSEKEINIIYDIKEENKIRIFGGNFVYNNRNICKMIIRNMKLQKNILLKSIKIIIIN